jgi:hypothetical protein
MESFNRSGMGMEDGAGILSQTSWIIADQEISKLK